MRQEDVGHTRKPGAGAVAVVAEHVGHAVFRGKRRRPVALGGDAPDEAGHLEGDAGQGAENLGVADGDPRLFHPGPSRSPCLRVKPVPLGHPGIQPDPGSTPGGDGHPRPELSGRDDEWPGPRGVPHAPVEDGEEHMGSGRSVKGGRAGHAL